MSDPTKGKQWVRFEVVNRLLENQKKELIEKVLDDLYDPEFKKEKMFKKWEEEQ